MTSRSSSRPVWTVERVFPSVYCCVCPLPSATSVVCVCRARASEWYRFSQRYSLLIESFVEKTTVSPILVSGLLFEEHTGGRVKIYREPSLPWLQVYSGLAHRKRPSRWGEKGRIGKDHPGNWYASLSTNFTLPFYYTCIPGFTMKSSKCILLRFKRCHMYWECLCPSECYHTNNMLPVVKIYQEVVFPIVFFPSYTDQWFSPSLTLPRAMARVPFFTQLESLSTHVDTQVVALKHRLSQPPGWVMLSLVHLTDG